MRLNPKPSQVLKSAGRSVRQASFVQHRKDGGNQGLKFSEAVMDQQKGASPPPRQWVMDFQARAVRGATSDWVPAYGDPAREQDWTVEERKDGKGLGLVVRVGPSTLHIPLPYINRPTALALLPAVGEESTPGGRGRSGWACTFTVSPRRHDGPAAPMAPGTWRGDPEPAVQPAEGTGSSRRPMTARLASGGSRASKRHRCGRRSRVFTTRPRTSAYGGSMP